jgi:hypothetical protein
MGLDIRIPLGLIFLITGFILWLFGLVTRHNAALYAPSMGINLNLVWGSVMFLFGLVMFLVGRHQKWQDDPVTHRPWERGSNSKRGH